MSGGDTNAYARKRADMLAGLSYTALAVDMYGDGKQANHPDEAGKFAAEVSKNMPLAKARFEADLKGVASFHGSLGTDNPAQPGKVKARIISFTGENDRMISADTVAAFRKEMESAGRISKWSPTPA